MATVTDLPLRESTSERRYSVPENFTLAMPSFLDWVKAGVGFTTGAVLVVLVASYVFARVLYPLYWLAILQSFLR